MTESRYICVDLDGTIAHYQEWKGEDSFGDPVPGVQQALTELQRSGWIIIIFTTRSNVAKIRDYLNQNEIPFDYINENPDQPANAIGGKIYADVYVDDRAIQFTGDWQEAIGKIVRFKPWEEDVVKSTSDLDSEAIHFLERDFSECFSQMRHYDEQMLDVTKFSFAEMIAVIAGSWTILVFALESTNSSIRSNWPIAVIFVLLAGYIFGILSLSILARLRLYFTLVARYLNEHRCFFLKNEPLGFQNRSRMYTDFKNPRPYDPWSTQMLSIYAIAFVDSLLLAGAIGCVALWFKWLLWQIISIAGISYILSVIIIIIWTRQYLRNKEDKGADEAVFGVNSADKNVQNR